MKLDLLYEIDAPKPWEGRAPLRAAGGRAALPTKRPSSRSSWPTPSGFHTTWHVEHHFREGRSHSPAPEVILGALAQATEHLRLGFGVTLMPHPFTPPMRVAEKVATADILSGGRVEWGTGRSTPMEQTAFGVPKEESRASGRRPSTPSSRCGSPSTSSTTASTWTSPRRMVTPKPFQDPHPPCWMAATTDGSADVAGHPRSRPAVALHPQAARPAGPASRPSTARPPQPQPLTRVTTNKVAAYTLVHCADTMAEAEANGIWDSVWWWYQNLAEFMLEWEFPHFSEEEQDGDVPAAQQARLGANSILGTSTTPT